VPPGSFRIEAAQPVTVNGTSYEWNVTINAPAGETRVELTNQNATTRAGGSAAVAQAPGTGFTPSSPTLVAGPGPAEAVPASATGGSTPDQPVATVAIVSAGDAPRPTAGPPAPARQRQMAPEMEIYRQVRTGVFRIEAGLAHGTGFLVDTAGFILTNAHVVSGQSKAAAALDSATRVEAQIVYRDDERDVAVLRVSPAAVRGRPALQLSVGSPLVDPGERVFAVGYPLNQEQTLTSGIVSGVREAAIISDVNINHGNSGGPLMNLAGEVVGINTFGDFTTQGGPGISGAILITRAIEPLSTARGKAAKLPMPSPMPLPSLPPGRFTTHELKAFADSVKVTRYEAFDSISVGKFEIALTTPPIAYVREKAFEQIVGKDRKKREARANLDENARYSEMRESRDWQEYVGDERAPVIALTVEPKLGETSGSVFRRLLVTGLGGKTTIRYSGDLEAASIYRNGEPVVPLTGGTTPVKQYIDNRWVDLKDVANYGFYVVAADAFAPGADGVPPSIVIELADLKNPGNESCRELPPDVVAIVWNDFALYHAARGEPFTAADPKARPAQAPNISAVCAASRKARNAPPVERSDAPNPMGGIRP
jgi:putative serine protease PepD